MNHLKLFTLIFVLFLGSSFSTKNEIDDIHDIHVTKCNIDFSDEEKTLQVTLHIYLDDLEAAIKKEKITAEKLNLCTPKEHADGNKYVAAYFKKMFSLEVNNQSVDFDFLGKESAKNILAGWFYLEVKNVEELNDLKINYKILTNLYDDQQNVIRLKGPNKKKGYFLLNNKKTSAHITY